jgi:membrane protein DedA with SNARE-associated domain
MVEAILAHLATLVIAVISAGGYPGITLLMALVSTGVPIPSEIIMPFAGYLVSKGTLGLPGVIIAAVIGENIGARIGYELGARGGRPLLVRYGRYVLLDAHHLDLAERFFRRWGSVAALVGRLLPVVRAFVSIPAGLGRMNLVKFHVYTTIGSAFWCGGLAWLGVVLGDKWDSDPRLKAAFHSADLVIGVVLVLAVVAVLWLKLRGARARH